MNKIIVPRKLNEKLLDKIIRDLMLKVNAYRATGYYMLRSTKQSIERQKFGNVYCIVFSFSEKDIKLLKDNNVPNKISAPMSEVYDHDTAETIREFCRSTAAMIIIRILPYIPLFHINYVSIFFHYDFSLPNIDYTRRIYDTSVHLDKIRALRLKDLDEKNIKNYFELENSQIHGLFPEWKGRGVLLRPEVNEMV
jgi:hypothetical protein